MKLNRVILLVLVAGTVATTAWTAETERRLVVALLQLQPDGNDLEANAQKAEDFCRKAKSQGADIALLPEMWSIGYTRFKPDVPGDREEFYRRARPADGPYVQRFASLAKELGMAIAFTYLQEWEPRHAL